MTRTLYVCDRCKLLVSYLYHFTNQISIEQEWSGLFVCGDCYQSIKEKRMISQQERSKLKILARDIGYQVEITVDEIRVIASYGDTIFSNDEAGYFGAAVMLEKLKIARDEGKEI